MATFQLEQFLKSFRGDLGTVAEIPSVRTVPGIGPGTWDRNALANSQGQAGKVVKPAQSVGTVKTLYRLMTQDINRNQTVAIVKRYFEGATLTYGIGLDARTQQADENAVVIEIVTSAADAFQRIVNLAGDIRVINGQISVLITRQDITTFEVTARTATHGEL